MPTRFEIINHLREHYSLTLAQVVELLKQPIHPQTLRDQLAISAMQGMLTNSGTCKNNLEQLRIANSAYAQADAMLYVRTKPI